ncbi:MAG TPA: acetoacetate--CoA ligase [Gaiella sp.]|uniref:acetoacetate--CoA ligase n=1 Tax=Gaiella sp. TaxID=2663207 RepID=UPI002D7F1160|nr:acetoacetate--CoA ligase [Gaiella sp.]HET9289378.1 acetoacetate--CoA ligase [Gaiella sp.]
MTVGDGRVLTQGQVLWTPPADARERFLLGRFMGWLRSERGLDLSDYEELRRWSIADLEGFWSAVWDFFEIRAHEPYQRVLGSREMPGAEWFPGARLNYAEHMVGRDEDVDSVAVVAHSQSRDPIELTFGDLREQVARARAGLQRLGVGPGDRVVAYLPNIPETLVAFLATASLGAIWATCPPEFGVRSVLDRLGQLEPKVLLAVAGYRWGDKHIDRREQVAPVRAGLPSLEALVHVPYAGGPDDALPDAVSWDELLREQGELAFDPLPFAHPLYVLFSSGTTGLPKAIVHCHGGILIEHLKNHGFSWDLQPGDRLQWFTTTAWMMWNALVSVLLLRASIVMIDGNPVYPDVSFQWALAEKVRPTFFGLSPAFTMACRKEGLEPGRLFDLSSVRMVCEAGSPLPLEGYAWLYEQFGPDVMVNVGSGGTDVCTGIVQGVPLLPVYAGEMSTRMLGVDAEAFGPDGKPVVGELGELVIRQPMPSMPVGFWNDDDGSRYRAAYFDHYPGIWRFGDWIVFTERGSSMITGRSDATLNRGGVRLGSSEIYSVVEEHDEVLDSLVVHLEEEDELLLFVVLRPGVELDDGLRTRIDDALRNSLSPRHAPDTIVAVPAIPRTLTGKKLEVPVKRILTGAKVSEVAARDALVDPASIEPFAAFARTRAPVG